MKVVRITCIFVLIALMFSCCSAELLNNYNAYYNQMLQEVKYGDFDAAKDIYDKICEIWPVATDRAGDTDNIGVYAYARVAMDEKMYNDACRMFSALPADFGNAYGQITADLLLKYCEAQRYLVYGYADEALAKFLQCNGILDASFMISVLLNGQEEMLIGLKALLIESNSITIKWDDMASDNDTYVITCMPNGAEARTKTIQSTMTLASIDGLIPETNYIVYILPYKKGVVNGKSVSAEFTTAAASEGSQTVRMDKLEVYSYDIRTKNAVNSIIGTKDYFLEQFLNNRSDDKSTLLEDGKSMYMPLSGMKIADDGFILRCTLRNKGKINSTDIKIVLRPANGASYDYDRTVSFDSITGIGGFCIYLDDMLDEIYKDNNGWPYGIMFIDVYADNVHIKRIQFKLDTVEK